MPKMRWFFMTMLSILTGINSDAQVGNFCPSGTCDIANPIIVNVYWDANWDADVAAAGGDFSMERIDALTSALIHSSYFSALAQYSVTSVSGSTSIVETAFGAPPPNLDLVINQLGNLGNWIRTEHPELDPNRTILNVMIPPQIGPKDTSADFCKLYAGEHDQFGSPFGITFIPTSSKCNGSLGSIFATMSHEMVEAATDPVPQSPTGWKAFADGEIGDKCEDITSSVRFLFGRVQNYISNSLASSGAQGAAACTVGFSPTAAPTFSSPAGSVCGVGPAMTITVNGVFGARPFDLPPFGKQTLYLQARVFHPDGSLVFNAGNFMGFPLPDAIGFGGILWTRPTGSTSDKIVIKGFVPVAVGGSIPAVSPGDSVMIKVWSQASGQPAMTTLVVPSVGVLTLAHVIQWNAALPLNSVIADSTASIEGSIQSGACPFAGVSVHLSSSDPTDLIPNTTIPTQGNGQFSGHYIARTAGVKTITASFSDAGNHIISTASIPVTVYPTINKLKQNNGTPAGGQTVIVTGTGFAASTNLVFNGSTITNRTISSTNSMSFVTPRSPFGGDGAGNVNVSASVGAEASNTMVYSYIVPDSPRIDYLYERCGISSFSIDAYNADGTINTNEQIRLTAGYAAFAGGTQDSIIVTAGQTLEIMGTGPITATDIANPALTTTTNIPLYPDLCGLGLGVPGDYGPANGGLNIYKPKPSCTKCGPGGIDVSIWQAAGDPNPGDFFAIQGRAALAEAKAISVAGLPAAELKTLISTNSIVFVQGAVAGDRVAFTGAAVRIEVGSKSEVAERSRKAAAPQRFKSQAELSFAIPSGASNKSSYRILHLVETKGKAAWAEVPVEGIGKESGSVKVKVVESGVYALGLVVRGRQIRER